MIYHYIYYFLFLGLYFGRFSPKKVTWLPFQATTSLFFETIRRKWPLSVIKAHILKPLPPPKKHHKSEVKHFFTYQYSNPL